MSLRPLGAGIAGGLLAGAAVGAAEALASWFGAHGTGDLPPIAWALAVYGLIGRGGVPHVRLTRNGIRIRPADLAAFVAGQAR